MNLTIESIEGMPPEEIQALRDIAAELHQSTVLILETPMSPQDYEREERLRDAMIIKLRSSVGKIRSDIADMEAVIRDTSILMSWLRSDRQRLESKKIEGFVREKEDRMKNFSQRQ